MAETPAAARAIIEDARLVAAERLEVEAALARKTVRQVAFRTSLIVGAGVLIVVVLQAVLLYSLIRTNADALDRDRAQRCESNQGQHVLWEGILSLTGADPADTADTATVRRFRVLLDTTFPLDDCQ